MEIGYYKDEVALEELNSTSVRSPLQVYKYALPSTQIAPGDSFSVQIPQGPANTHWVVVHQGVGTTSALEETEDWVQTPAPTSSAVPGTNLPLLIALSAMLLGLGVLGLKRWRTTIG